MANERMLQELEVTLRQFPLLHMETHVLLPEFGVSLEECARVLYRQRLKISSPTLAAFLRDRARSKNLDEDHLRYLTRKLRLMTKALSGKSDWYAYTLEGKSTPDEPIRDAIALAPQRIQKALRHAQNRCSKIEVHSVKVDRWIIMCVETIRADGSTLSPLYLAMQPNTNFVFASRTTLSPLVSGSIAVGLGWTSAANASLSGRHLESLLRVLQQDKNGTVNGLLSPPPYAPRAVFTRSGIHCTDQDYDLEYSKNILGQDPPTLRKIVGVSNQPFCDEPEFGAGLVSFAIKLESDDVAGMLTSLVRVKAIAANSPWLHAFRSTTSNVIDLDNEFTQNE